MKFSNISTFNIFFKTICIIIAVFLTVYWSYEFFKNEDTSFVEYTKYLESDKDIYPVLSFCFQNPFNETKLQKYNVTKDDYIEFLKGTRGYFSSKFLEVPYDDITLQVDDHITKHFGYYKYFINGTEKNMTSEEGRNVFEVSTSYNGFIHQRFFKCFSLESKSKERIRMASLGLSQDIFKQHSRAKYYSFITLFHYPQQLLRSSGTMRRVWKDRKDDSEFSMWFTLTGMDVMNRRHKQDNTCISNWRDYDNELLEKHIRELNCTVPYHPKFNFSGHSPCQNELNMQKAAMFGPDQYEEFGLEPPCRSVEKIEFTYVEHELDASPWNGKGHFWIELIILDQRFRETTQSR